MYCSRDAFGMEAYTEMAQWEKVLAAKHEDPSPVPETHLVEGENQLPQVLFWPQTYTVAHICVKTHIHNKCK